VAEDAKHLGLRLIDGRLWLTRLARFCHWSGSVRANDHVSHFF
jgi:hypothetical protein